MKDLSNLSLTELRFLKESYDKATAKPLSFILEHTEVKISGEIDSRYVEAKHEMNEDVYSDVVSLATKWSEASDDQKKVLIEQYQLGPILSSKGSLKLAIENTLKVNPDYVWAGLSENHDLLFASGRTGNVLTVEAFLREAKSGDKEAYQKFFKSALKKFGVKSPAELDGDKEKEFYDYIDKNWESKDEEVQEAIIHFESPSDKKSYVKKHQAHLDDDSVYTNKNGNSTSIVVSDGFISDYKPSEDDLVDRVQEAADYSTIDARRKEFKETLKRLGVYDDYCSLRKEGKITMRDELAVESTAYQESKSYGTVKDNHGNVYNVTLRKSRYSSSPVVDLTTSSGKSAPGGWDIETLKKKPSDKLFVDAGQGWYVTGMNKVLANIEKDYKEDYEHVEEATSADLKKVQIHAKKLGAKISGDNLNFGKSGNIKLTLKGNKIYWDDGEFEPVEYSSAKEIIDDLDMAFGEEAQEALQLYADVKALNEDLDPDLFADFLEDYEGELDAQSVSEAYKELLNK